MSLVSRPLQPALPRTAPPTVPGSPTHFSRPEKPPCSDSMMSLATITPASAVTVAEGGSKVMVVVAIWRIKPRKPLS